MEYEPSAGYSSQHQHTSFYCISPYYTSHILFFTNFYKVQDFSGRITANMVETARELESEVEFEEERELRQSLMIKLEQMRNCFLWSSKESDFLRWNLCLVKML